MIYILRVRTEDSVSNGSSMLPLPPGSGIITEEDPEILEDQMLWWAKHDKGVMLNPQQMLLFVQVLGVNVFLNT